MDLQTVAEGQTRSRIVSLFRGGVFIWGIYFECFPGVLEIVGFRRREQIAPKRNAKSHAAVETSAPAECSPTRRRERNRPAGFYGTALKKMLRGRSHFHEDTDLVLRPEKRKTREILQHHRPAGEEDSIRPKMVAREAGRQIAVRGMGHFPERGFQDRGAPEVRFGFRTRISRRGAEGRTEGAIPKPRNAGAGARSSHAFDEHEILAWPIRANRPLGCGIEKVSPADNGFRIVREEFQAAGGLPLLDASMKSPTPESSFKLIEAIRALLQCDELLRADVSDSTHQLIEEVIETVGQVERECEFPARAEIVAFFAKRFAEEEKETLVRRVVALVGTLSKEELYSSYAEAIDVKRDDF